MIHRLWFAPPAPCSFCFTEQCSTFVPDISAGHSSLGLFPFKDCPQTQTRKARRCERNMKSGLSPLYITLSLQQNRANCTSSKQTLAKREVLSEGYSMDLRILHCFLSSPHPPSSSALDPTAQVFAAVSANQAKRVSAQSMHLPPELFSHSHGSVTQIF